MERYQAVQELKKTDWHPYPHKFQTTHTLKEFNAKFSELQSGEDLKSEAVSLAGTCMHVCGNFLLCSTLMCNALSRVGRINAKRELSNKLIFYDIRHIDGTKVQIMADAR